jgi:molybdate transport system ATP-binding protein
VSDPGAGLRAQIDVRRADFALSLRLSAEPGQVLALLGPNGAGKSTTLRALAGLVPLSGGWVTQSGVVLEDTAARVRVPTEARGIGMVFQDYLLFPHLSALENVAFGLRARGVARRAARQRAAGWLDRMGLSAHTRSRPSAPSGGQA